MAPVIRALERGHLGMAKESIAMVVGRDVRDLDHAGISRAGVETLAENFVDGFLSPLFWFTVAALTGDLFGLPPVISGVVFMLIFKVGSTLDSMVGYRDARFLEMGRAGARFDDWMNFLPARLSLALLFLGSSVSGLHPMDGFRVALRDRFKHDSPNAAHAESFVAGALHVRLGGPARYAEVMKDKPWLGAEYPDPGPSHLRSAALLIQCAAWVSMAVVLSVLLFAFGTG